MVFAKEVIDPPMGPEWAYILGLIAADGCITDSGEFSLGLKKTAEALNRGKSSVQNRLFQLRKVGRC